MNVYGTQQTVAGQVLLHNTKAPTDCYVSNGEAIVPVKSDGTYELNFFPDKHRFIFVIPPDGYRCTNQFWRTSISRGEALKQTDFRIKPYPQIHIDKSSFLHITDTHLAAKALDQNCIQRYGLDVDGKSAQDLPSAPELEDILNKLIEQAPDAEFLLITGDITNMGEAEAIKDAAHVFKKLPISVYSIFGGHDGNAERARSKEDNAYLAEHFTEYLAPAYYCWNHGNRHYISFVSETHFLDSQTVKMQQSFVKESLRIFGKNKPVTICSHKHPYPWNIETFRDANVDSWIHGHFHSGRVYEEDGIRVFCTGATTFGNFDATPAQARLFTFSNDDKLTSHPIALDRQSPPTTTKNTVKNGLLKWQYDSVCSSHLAAPYLTEKAIYFGIVDEEIGLEGGVVAVDFGGTELWRKPICGSVIAPVTAANEHVVAVTQTGHVVCLNNRQGDLVWEYDLPDVYDRWIYAPLLVTADTVIVGTTSLLACLSIQTGKLIWMHRDPKTTSDAFCQLQGPALYDRNIFLPGFATETYLLDAGSGEVLNKYDDRRIRYGSRHTCINGEYFVGSADGSLHRFDLKDGSQQWSQKISESSITSGCASYNDSMIIGTAEGVGRYDRKTGKQLAFCKLGPSQGMYVPYRTQTHCCASTPCVVNDLTWAASGEGYINLLDAQTLTVQKRFSLDAPIIAPLVADTEGHVYGTDVTGRLLCMIYDESTISKVECR